MELTQAMEKIWYIIAFIYYKLETPVIGLISYMDILVGIVAVRIIISFFIGNPIQEQGAKMRKGK